MAKKALNKDIYVEIKKSIGRFISIFMIVALGVSFFSGLRSTETDMRYTGDAFADQYNLMDLRVISTLGLTDSDVEALRQVEGVDKAEPSYMKDVVTNREDTDYVVELLSLPQELNQIQVTEGRLPEKEGEILLDNRLKKAFEVKIGDTIAFSSGKEDALEESLTQTQYTVAGFGDSPLFISMERGSTTVGSGQINGFGIVLPEVFDQDYYTQIYLTVAGAYDEIAFTDEYAGIVETVQERVEALEEERCLARYDEVTGEPRQELEDGEAEYLTQKEEAEQELADARAELDDGWAELEDGRTKLSEGEAELAEKESQLAQSRQEYEDGLAALEEARVQLESSQAEYDAGYDITVQTLTQQQAQLDAGKSLMTEEQITEAQAQIDAGYAQLQAAADQLSQGWEQLSAQQAQLDEAAQQLSDGELQLEEGKAQLESSRQELADAEESLKSGEEEYVSSSAEAREKLADARAELDDGWADLEEIQVPQWQVIDRDSLAGYSDYGDNAERMGAIGKVFPAIFFLVAALVALTAITRMVEEQRTLIGTYKALGYSKAAIAKKYLVYSLAATLGGSVAGVLIGEKLFPFVIIISYRLMYTPLLTLEIPYNWYYAAVSTGIAVLSVTVAALAACYKELLAQPAVLMRPVSPKPGKRVFLERIGILWKHLSFSQKNTFRNLFRYKKRLIMTVFGIGCCTGLLVVGFGLKDSIMNIAALQYENIQLYDAMVSLDEDKLEGNQEALEEEMASEEGIESFVEVNMRSMDVTSESNVRTAYTVVCRDAQALDSMIVFANRKETYELDDSGVIITQQMADALDVEEGDTIMLTSGEGAPVAAVVSHIMENYLMHYVYMTEEYYEIVFGEPTEYNMYWLRFTRKGDRDEEVLGRQLMENEAVLTVSYVSTTREMIDSMLQSLYIIVLVLVISASLLAFVVIYNLNNINISERRRELATIKLLGFYDGEVAQYVYRENIYLTFMGSIAGLFIGKILHSFVMDTVQVNQVMFGREVSTLSYLYSILLTVAFSAVVNGVMYFQLKKIDMIESLKSVE